MSDASDRAGDGAGHDNAGRDGEEPLYPDVPDWDDEYLDRVSDRVMFNYDLEKHRSVRGRTFDLFGTMRVESQKHFLHPSLNYANHASEEYLFADRRSGVSVADLEQLVSLADDLAEDPQWLVADEEHYGTDFTFVLVVPSISEEVREFVAGHSGRNLIKYGYYGHYEVNLAVVAPDDEAVVASENADVARAFTLWSDVDPTERSGLLSRLLGRLR
ncbi:hypothetical protein AUR64_00335 [Haloprofundus marisrubri]|uniref:DUF8052 domain-containing protein n=1 Tax=Haloprofundus marisrubri TaxID=1514971 RepID=A0A0W1RDL9_9EURY|nr:hypothetical protein [Haloprofundus marisrubri]KTG11674.1 hypothetical protein AUR64_00335 [Haloprofundus marisrubri]